MKHWDNEGVNFETEGFIQHRKRCTGTNLMRQTRASKSKTEEEPILRVEEGDEEVEVVEDEQAELQMLLDAVTDLLAPEE